jgi:UDP-glucose:(heptosyl)LPS alpha-1,3-glucosyltransferase
MYVCNRSKFSMAKPNDTFERKNMKLAFCIYKFFPYGGLQRDFLNIVYACLNRGYDIDIYTTSWDGDLLQNVNVYFIKPKGITNHTRIINFAQKVNQEIERYSYDAVIGFNKMPGLDFYFAGDICLKAKYYSNARLSHKLFARYRQYLRLEKSIADQYSKTKILYLTEQQKQDYIKYYNTQANRFFHIPAGIKPNQLSYQERAAIKCKIRQQYKIKENDVVVLFVASKFMTKGLDRVVMALSNIKAKYNVKLWIIGGDRQQKIIKLIDKYKIAANIEFLGKQNNLYDYMMAADLFVNPARVESAGMSIIESIVNGLPSIITKNCGYSFHVKTADCGIVLHEPYKQNEFNMALENLVLDPAKRKFFHSRALSYASDVNLYDMGAAVADVFARFLQ